MAATTVKAAAATASDKQQQQQPLMSGSKRDRAEMMEQSLIVSQVALQLDQHARKARKKGLYFHNNNANNKSGGRVTPPLSWGVLTYDDEKQYAVYDDDDDDQHHDAPVASNDTTTTTMITLPHEGSISLISESSESGSEYGEEDSSVADQSPTGSSRSANGMMNQGNDSATSRSVVPDRATADQITQRLWNNVCLEDHAQQQLLAAPLTVAGFCMTTLPSSDNKLDGKILQFMVSSENVLAEFHTYRLALNPAFAAADNDSNNSALTQIQQDWARPSSRRHAVRDFEMFAVNCLQLVLVLVSSNDNNNIIMMDHDILQRTMNLWSKSCIGRTA